MTTNQLCDCLLCNEITKYINGGAPEKIVRYCMRWALDTVRAEQAHIPDDRYEVDDDQALRQFRRLYLNYETVQRGVKALIAKGTITQNEVDNAVISDDEPALELYMSLALEAAKTVQPN